MLNCIYLNLTLPGLQRSAFDNKTVSFEDHVRLEHNMWHYLNFIVLVKTKKSTEFTGPESYVSEMVKVHKFTIAPTWTNSEQFVHKFVGK